jgi:hypothetical protein
MRHNSGKSIELQLSLLGIRTDICFSFLELLSIKFRLFEEYHSSQWM